MSNSSISLCPAPFLDESLFPYTEGYIKGRLCSDVPLIAPGLRCCLPCPADYWIYPDRFYSLTRIAGYVNAAGLGLCTFMLLSFIVLPAEHTKRHYLNVCLIVATVMLELGFTIPVAARPVRCHDEITPNDMHSSDLCAWSGALAIAGGIAATSWILIRAISMHLQICWDVVPGRKFFWGAQVVGWGMCAALVTACLAITGVSFRFGDYCHINHYKGLETLWGPLLGLGGVSMSVQFATFVYCLHVYLKNRVSETKPGTNSSRGAASSQGSTRTQSASTVWQRVRKVIIIQWRGLVIVILVVADVVYFSIVFVYLDNQIQSSLNDVDKVLPWLFCLVENQGDKYPCLDLAKVLSVNEAVVEATLIMLAIVGIEVWLLVGRWSMVTGWIDLFRRKPTLSDGSALEAGKLSTNKRHYELLQVTTPATTVISSPQSVASPERIIRSPWSPFASPTVQTTTNTTTLDRANSREWQRPRMSFSSPKVPVSSRSLGTTSDRSPNFARSDSFGDSGRSFEKQMSPKGMDGWI